MKRLGKIAGILAIILILAVAGVLLAAKILITPERVRDIVVPIAEKQLSRPVSIGEIDVRIFSGIVVSDFTIGAREGDHDFISARSLVMRYRFWPLLRFSVVVDEIRLVDPSIRVTRYESGDFNFSDLLAEKPPGDPEATDAPDAPEEGEGGLPIDLLVNRVSISGGNLFFTDHMVGQEYQVTGLSASVSDFAPDLAFPFELSANINNAPIRLEGWLDPEAMAVSASLFVEDLDVAAFMPYAPEDFPGKVSRMKLDMDIRAEATAETAVSEGRISIRDIDMLLDDMPDAPVGIAGVFMDYDIDVDFVSGDIGMVIGELRVVDPSLRVERYENGDFSFSGFLAEKPPGSDGTTEAGDASGDGDADLPIDLLVNRVSISGGNLFFTDHMVGQEYQVTGLSASVSDFAPDLAFPFELSASINNAPVRLDGRVDPEAKAVSTSLYMEDLDVAAFMPYAPADFPGKVSRMKLDVDVRAEATAETAVSEGRISIRDMDILLDGMPDAPIQKDGIFLDYEMEADLVSESITIASADLDIDGLLLSASGHVFSYGTGPVLDITARLPMTDLSLIAAAVPPPFSEPIAGMQPFGRVGAQIQLQGEPGSPENLVEKGEITLEEAGVTMNQLSPGISGAIRIAKDSAISDNLVVQLGDDRVAMDFTVENLMGPVIHIHHTATAERLDVDRLLAAMADAEAEDAPAKEAPEAEAVSEAEEEIGPFDIPMEINGALRAANAVFKGMDVKDFDVQYALSENVLTVDPVRGSVAGGQVRGMARAELNRTPITYTADISVEETRAELILESLFPKAANTVFGTMFLNAGIKGEGTTWNTIRQTLSSKADVNISNGRLTGEGLAGGLAGFLESGKLEVLGFDSLKGDVVLESGRFNIDGRFTGDHVRMSPVGTMGLDGSLRLSLDLRVSPEVASDIGRDLAGRLPRTDDGWYMVPMRVSGTTFSPQFELDASAIADHLLERGREELQKQLRERLAPERERDETSDEPGAEEEKSIERQLEDALRKLFN